MSFPYVTLTPPTVIKLSGTCITNGVVTGYGYAAVLNILEERYAALTIQNPGGVAYFYFDVPLGQRAPTSSEVSALANTTGIPSSEVGRSSMTLRSDTNASPTAVTYVLPAGVGMSYFLGTSTSQAGYVRFTASSQPPLDQVVTGLGSGIQVDMPILQQSGSDAYTYRVTLNSASPQVTVTTVTVR